MSVHDYTNFSLSVTPNSLDLADSGAYITIYQGTSEPRVFNVPAGIGVLWTVFELNGTTITPIGTMGDVDDETNIRSLATHSDADLIKETRCLK